MLLCDGGVEQAVAAVGAYATDLIGFDFSAPTGATGAELLNASFSLHGIPIGVRYPASAEEAAARVAAATGRKVVSVPRLVRARVPLAGWWSHIVIDFFTHSADYYSVPVLYPFTYWGFDGLAWNTPWFLALNYAVLSLCIAALALTRRR